MPKGSGHIAGRKYEVGVTSATIKQGVNLQANAQAMEEMHDLTTKWPASGFLAQLQTTNLFDATFLRVSVAAGTRLRGGMIIWSGFLFNKKNLD